MTNNVKSVLFHILCPLALTSLIFLGIHDNNLSFKENLRRIYENGLPQFKSQFYNEPPPEAFMSTPQIIKFHGYPVQEHKVMTEDGYILTLFRIPSGKSNKRWRKEPVLIQHGILCSSSDWFLPAADSLPYLLADNGHDVWIGNGRGSNYSLEHETLHQNDLKFWDYGLDEFGRDVPAVVNYILQTSNATQLNWVGHSMGCTMLFIAINHHPSLNDKIKNMVVYAPAVYVQNIITPFFRLCSLFPASFLCGLTNFFAGGRFLPPSVTYFIRTYGPYICSGKLMSEVCNMQHFLFTGFSRAQTTDMTAPFTAGHMPSETAGKTLAHYAQYIQGGKFQAYDFGTKENLKRYKTSVPPLYHLSKVKIPIIAFYGLNDWLATPKDVHKTMSQLGNVKKVFQVSHENWNHLDFLYGKDAKVLVYEPTIKYLESSN